MLEGVGVRPTRQRVTVLSELMGERNDVTAQELHERLRGRGERLGLATVYRTLGLLTDEGVIDALWAGIRDSRGPRSRRGSGARRARSGASSSPTVNRELYSSTNGCPSSPSDSAYELGPWLERISEAHGFVTTGHRLEVSGLCESCRA